MWTQVVFEGANASSGIAMAHELRSAGLTLDQDFTWQYIPNSSVTITYHEDQTFDANMQKRHVIICFRNPALATFYSLKWQR